MNEEIAWLSEDKRYAIVASAALFSSGYNVYEIQPGEGSERTAVKINDPLSFFISLDAAKDWLEKHLTPPPA